MNSLVIRVGNEDDGESDFVEYCKHRSRADDKEIGDNGDVFGKVGI